MKRNMLLVLAALVVGTAVGPLAPSAQAQRARGGGALDPVAQAALLEALAGPEGEYAAHATYAAILEAFGGDVQPYASILLAEQKHAEALIRQCVKFGVAVPDDIWSDNVVAPASLLEAAQTGVEAELANIAMYDDWLSLEAVRKHPSLVQVFTNLRNASFYNHLPAFEAAVDNGGTLPATAVGPKGQRKGATQGAYRSRSAR